MNKKLLKWLDYEFSSNSITGEDYKAFEKDFLGFIKKELKKKEIEFVTPCKNHYECACIIKNLKTNKFAYFSISDVRFFPNEWYYEILYRDCKNEKDWTGGNNRYCNLKDLIDNLEKITQ